MVMTMTTLTTARLPALSLAVCLGLGLGTVPTAQATVVPGDGCPGRQLLADPLMLYGERMQFSVARNGTPVGTHTVEFRRQGQDLIVDTLFDIEVKLLFVTAYRFRYQATDRWRDGCLVDMQVSVDDDGQRTDLTARLDNDRLKVTGPAGIVSAPAEIYPTHHWNAGVVGSEVILNTITGNLGAVRMLDRGVAPVPINGQLLPARHFAYTGDLENEVWYDPQGRWVKMRFKGKDGSTIEYRCETCARNLTANP